MNLFTPLRAVFASLFFLASAPVHAGWTLVPDASRLGFVSIKNNTVAETHRFTRFNGSVADDGQAKLQISLDTVETGIAIRNERMRELLFETAKFPQATVALTVDWKPLLSLAIGEHLLVTTNARLDLHGVANTLPAELRVTRLGADRLLVSSEQPVLVNAMNHGLINGIDALRKVAGLQAIGSGVPVHFSLLFVRAP